MTDVQDETVEQLRQDVQGLRDEVQVLRNAIDELREIFEYAVQNGLPIRSSLDGHARRITSMPIDPTAPDFAMRVNRFAAADVTDNDGKGDGDEGAGEVPMVGESASNGRQRELFE